MRKLVIGIAVVALLALMAVPAMAKQVGKENLNIVIEVGTWGAIRFSDAVLSLNVTEPWEDGMYEAVECKSTKNFTVLCNADSTLTVTADETSKAKNPPGEGYYYPVATYTDGSVEHKIGFGVTLRNTNTSTSMPWDHRNWYREAHVSFSLDDTPENLTDHNAAVQINSYMDSTRGTDALAPEGTYTTHLILTLTIP